MTAFGVIYYLLPADLAPGLYKATAFIILLLLILVFESFRIQINLRITGLRQYEYSRLSGFAWAFLGIAMVVLFFPVYIAVPCLLAMAFLDPLAGELRARGRSTLSNVIWPVAFGIFMAAFIIFLQPVVYSLPMGFAGSTTSWLSEKFKFKSIDDDFLMAVIPAFTVYLVRHLLSGLLHMA